MFMTNIDTLAFAKELQAAEFSRQQAEGLSSAIAKFATAELATKSDLLALRNELRSDLANFATKAELAEVKGDVLRLEQKMDLKLDSMEKSLTIKLGAFIVVAVGAVAAITKMMS
jgi:hypothetical protein